MTLPPGRPRPGGGRTKALGVGREGEEASELRPREPRAVAAAVERALRVWSLLSLLVSSLVSAKWRGVVEKGCCERVGVVDVVGLARALRPRTRRAAWRGIAKLARPVVGCVEALVMPRGLLENHQIGSRGQNVVVRAVRLPVDSALDACRQQWHCAPTTCRQA